MQIVNTSSSLKQLRENISYGHQTAGQVPSPGEESLGPLVTKGWISSSGLQLAARGLALRSELGSAKPDPFKQSFSLFPQGKRSYHRIFQRPVSETSRCAQHSPPPAAPRTVWALETISPTAIKHKQILDRECSPRKKQRCFGASRELILVRAFPTKAKKTLQHCNFKWKIIISYLKYGEGSCQSMS